MDVNSIQMAGDMFTMDGNSYDLETMLLALQMQRANNIDTLLRDQSELMKNQQDKLSQANQVMARLRAAEIDVKNTDPVTWTVDRGTNTIQLDGYTLSLDENNSQWILTNNETGLTTKTWGDPHVDINNDGSTEFETYTTWSLVLEDGTKITADTTPYAHNNSETLTTKLTITKGDQAIVVTGLDQNTIGDLNISDVTLNGRALDFQTADGARLIEQTTATAQSSRGGWIDERDGLEVNQVNEGKIRGRNDAETYNNEVDLSTEDQAFLRSVGALDGDWNGQVTGDFLKMTVERLRGFMDSQNSQSQLDMIRMQSLMNKRNQAFEMMTNNVSKLAKNKDSIIGNMR